MKKTLWAVSFAIGSIAFASIASASPSLVPLVFTCPTATGTGPNTLVNFGSFIGGYGTELINAVPSAPNQPYFSTTVAPGANIPVPISAGSYSHSGTNYNSGTGVVSCSYTSGASFDPFTVTYTILVNGSGGMISAQTTGTITIDQFIGLKS